MAFKPLEAVDAAVDDTPKRGFKPLEAAEAEPTKASSETSFVDRFRRVVTDLRDAVKRNVPQVASDAISKLPVTPLTTPVVTEAARRALGLPAPTSRGLFDNVVGATSTASNQSVMKGMGGTPVSPSLPAIGPESTMAPGVTLSPEEYARRSALIEARVPRGQIGDPRQPKTMPGVIASAARQAVGGVDNPAFAPIVRGVVGAADQLYSQSEGVARGISDVVGADTASDYFAQSRIEREAAAGNVQQLAGVGKFVEDAIATIGANAPFYWMAMGPLKNAVTPTQVATLMQSFAVTKAPTLAMAMGAGGARYNDPSLANLSQGERAQIAAVDAFWEFLGEQIGFGETIKALKTAGMSGEALTQRVKAMAAESLGESVTQLGQIENNLVSGLAPNMTPKQMLEQVAHAAAMGAIVSGSMQAGAAARSGLMNRFGRDPGTLDPSTMSDADNITALARQLLSDSETFDPGITSAGMRPVPQVRPGSVPRPPYLPGAEGSPPVLPGDLLSPEERILASVRETLDSIQPSEQDAPLPTIDSQFLPDQGIPMVVRGRDRGKYAKERTESAAPVALLPAPSDVASSPEQQIRPSEVIQGRDERDRTPSQVPPGELGDTDGGAILAAVRRIIGQQEPARDVTPPQPQEPQGTEYTVRPTERAASEPVGDRTSLGPSEDMARVLRAAQTPAFARTAEDISILRRYPDLAEAAGTPGFQRTAEQTALVQRARRDAQAGEQAAQEDRSVDDKTPKRYVIAERRTAKRGLAGVSAGTFTYEPDLRLGVYSTRTEAKAAFMRKMDPSLANAPDEFAAQHFDRASRNEGHFKVLPHTEAAISLARSQGITQAQIDAAVERARSDISSRRRAGRGGRESVVLPDEGGARAREDSGSSQAAVESGGRQAVAEPAAAEAAEDSPPRLDRSFDDRTPAKASVRTAGGAELAFKSQRNREDVKRLMPSEKLAVERAIADLGPTLAPPDVIAGLTFASRDASANGSYFPDQNVVTLSLDRLAMLRSADPTIRDEALHTLAHEIAHAIDFAASGERDAVSMSSPRLSTGFTDTDAGDLFDEAWYAWTNAEVDSDLGRILSYPLRSLAAGATGEKVAQLELFAQVSALYNVNPELVRTAMPKWAATLEQIYGDPTTGEGAPQSADEVHQRLREALSEQGASARAQERQPVSQGADRAANQTGPGAPRGPPRPGVGAAPQAGTQPAGQRPVGGRPTGPRAAAAPTYGLNEPALVDRRLREWQDRFIDVKRVRDEMKRAAGLITEGNDAYLAEELYHGRVSARVNKAARTHIEPLLEAMRDAKVSAEDLGKYLWARHAPERNKQMAKINPGAPGNLSGLYDDAAAAARDGNPGAANAADIIAGFRRAGRMTDLNRLAGMVDGITAATRQILVSEGLESQATINAWGGAYQNYVPLFRDIDTPSAGQGFKVSGKESKRALGSQKEAIAILAAVISQHERAIIRAERATVGRALIKMVEDNPNPDFWRLDTPPTKRTVNPTTGLVQTGIDPMWRQRDDVFIVKDKGANGEIVERVITFNPSNERAMAIASAMNNLGVVQLGAVTKVVGRITRVMANLVTTYNPQFWVTNFARDVQTAAVNLQDTELKGRAPQVIANIPRAMRGVLNAEKGDGTSTWAQTYREFQDSGGQTGWMQMWDTLLDRQAEIGKLLERAKRSRLDPREMGHKALEYVELANNSIENAIRLSAFAEARKMGLSPKRAASIAKNMTVNFNRKGNRSVAANAWYMFFNASVQGTARLVQAVATSRRARMYAGMMVAFAAALELVNRMLGDDDRDEDGNLRYELIPEHVRQRNMIFMMRDGKHIQIPLPYGFNVFHNAGRLMTEAILTASGSGLVQERKKPIDFAWSFTQTALDSFVPLGQTATPMQYAAPTIADPFVQFTENKTFFGSPMRPEPFPQSGPKPDHQLYFRSTSDTAKDLTRWLSAATGGTEREGGAIDISPTTIEHIVKTATGGVGQFGMVMLDFSRHTVNRALGEAEPEDYPARRVPFVGKFYGQVDDRDLASKYYRLRDDATRALKLLKGYEQDGDIERAERIRDEKAPLLAMAREISSQQYRREMSNLSKKIRAVDELPREERAQERRLLQRDEATLMARALRKYNDELEEQQR